MNNIPIISPMFIYWAGIVENLSITLTTLSLLAIGGIIIFTAITAYIKYDNIHWRDENTDKVKVLMDAWRKCVRPVFILAIVVILAAFIPNKETMYTMAVVKQITPQNIELVNGKVKDTIDYIFSKIKETSQPQHNK